jgi:hypothetical protein
MKEFFVIIGLTILQNAGFTLVSRARNSNSILFHGLAAVVSNLMFVLVLSQVVTHLHNFGTITGYVIGSVSGSIGMHYISMNFLEKKFKAKQQ